MYKYAAIAFLSLSLVSFGFYHKKVVSDYELKAKDMEISFNKAIQKQQEKQFNEVINAINEATKNNQQIRHDADNALAAANRLHKTIDNLNSQVSNISEQARIDYTNTLTDILKECTIAYREVAEKADGHANDAQLFFGIYKGNDEKPKQSIFNFNKQ